MATSARLRCSDTDRLTLVTGLGCVASQLAWKLRHAVKVKAVLINREQHFDFDVLLTVQLSIFILVINQLDAQNLFYNKFISCLYMFRAPCAHRQEVKTVLYSIWYHHTYRWSSGAV